MVLERLNGRNLEPQLIPDAETKKHIAQTQLFKGLPYRYDNYAKAFGFNGKGTQLKHTNDVVEYWHRFGEYTNGTPMPWYSWDAESRFEREEQNIHLQQWNEANEFIKHNFLTPFLSVPFYRLDPLVFDHTKSNVFTLMSETNGEDRVDGFTLRAKLSQHPEDDVVLKLVWNNGVEWKFYDELFKKIGLSKEVGPHSRGLQKLREHLSKRAIDGVRHRLAQKLEKYPHRENSGGLDYRVYAQVYAQATAHMMYPDTIPPVHSVFTYGDHLVGFATPFIEGTAVKLNEAISKYPYLRDIDRDLIDKGIHSDPFGKNVIIPSSPDKGKPQIIDLDLSRRTIG